MEKCAGSRDLGPEQRLAGEQNLCLSYPLGQSGLLPCSKEAVLPYYIEVLARCQEKAACANKKPARRRVHESLPVSRRAEHDLEVYIGEIFINIIISVVNITRVEYSFAVKVISRNEVSGLDDQGQSRRQVEVDSQ